jgi:hypothetical protein
MKEKKKYYFLYKTTCVVNNKYYIGAHSTNNIDDGYMGSGKYLKNSIKKYGKENFKRDILYFLESYSELLNKEEEIVTDDLLNDCLCMNLKQGGSGGWTVEQQRLNAIKSNEKQKWLWENDLEWRQKKSETSSRIDKELHEKGILKTWKENYSWIGKKHKEESKRKIGEKNSLNHFGEKNSQYNTCWIFNEKFEKNKKIRNEEIDVWIKQGWVKGRNIKF